jgi:hypothetical protein
LIMTSDQHPRCAIGHSHQQLPLDQVNDLSAPVGIAKGVAAPAKGMGPADGQQIAQAVSAKGHQGLQAAQQFNAYRFRHDQISNS